MSFSYNLALPITLNQVRFLIQDTNASRPLFQDEEINWVISTEANVYMAAAALCDVLVSQAGSVKFKKISEFSIAFDTKFYITKAALLRARGAYHQLPYAGGISAGDKLTQQSDSDWVTPAIVRNLDNNQSAPQPQTPTNNPLTTI